MLLYMNKSPKLQKFEGRISKLQGFPTDSPVGTCVPGASAMTWACCHCTTLNIPGNTICEACAKTRDVPDQDDAEVALDDNVNSELAAALHKSKICYLDEEKRNTAERKVGRILR